MAAKRITNEEIAGCLERVADLLEQQGENPFRAASYRRAADTVREGSEPLTRLIRRGGSEALQKLPGVGRRLAGAIEELVETGQLEMLRSLEAQASPLQILARLPGIGKALAERIHRELGIRSLEDLESAARDGRLEKVDGVGERKLSGIRDALAGQRGSSVRRRTGRRAKTRASQGRDERPPVSVLLGIDEQYRRKAKAGKLRTIAPRRFNPEGKAWLPVMEVERGGWSVTALYSNTARAHDLGKTGDWVVLYWQRNGAKGQNTIVTGTRGPLAGKRIVRGREAECREFHLR